MVFLLPQAQKKMSIFIQTRALTRAEHRIPSSFHPQIFIQHLLDADMVLGTGDAAVNKITLCPQGPKSSQVHRFCSMNGLSKWRDRGLDGWMARRVEETNSKHSDK